MTDPDTTPQSPLPSGQISEGDWYTYTGGKQYGPYPVQLLIQGIQDGRATRSLLVWRRGLGEWTAIGQLPEFAMLLQFADTQPENVAEASTPPEAEQPFTPPGVAPAGGPSPPGPGEAQRDLREITEVELQLLLTHFALSSEFQGTASGVLRDENFHPAKEAHWASIHRAMASVLKSGGPGPMSAEAVRCELLRQDDGLTLVERHEAFLNGLDRYDRAKLNVRYATDVLQRFVDARQVWRPMSNLKLEGMSVEEVSETFAGLVAKTRLSFDAKPESVEVGAFAADLIQRQKKPTKLLGYDTGFTYLDQIINGLIRGTIVILGGSPSVGKTTLLKQITDQVAEQRVPVIFMSYEQAPDELRIKTFGRLTGVDTRDLAKGRDPARKAGATTRDLIQKIQRAGERYAEFADFILMVRADARHTLDTIRSIVRTERGRHGLETGGLLVVDFLQKVPCLNPLTNRDFPTTRERLNFVLTELRRLATDLQVAVLAVSSLNRAAYAKERPRLDDFKESGDIEYTADVAIVLTETEVDELDAVRGASIEVPQSPGADPRGVTLHVLKNRNGDRGQVAMSFFPRVATFREEPRGQT